MPRNMSFFMTTEQFMAREKTVTRRIGWDFLKPGDVLNGVHKARGLKKGESVRRLGQIRIVSVRREPLSEITDDDVAKEGFPGRNREWFISFFLRGMGGFGPSVPVNRIEFEYL